MSYCDFAGKGSMQSFVMQIMVVAFVLASYESLKLLSDYRELENNILVNKPTSRYLSDSGRIIAMSTLKPNLGTGANNQNGNLRWYLPWRGGREGVSSATYLFWNMIFLKTI